MYQSCYWPRRVSGFASPSTDVLMKSARAAKKLLLAAGRKRIMPRKCTLRQASTCQVQLSTSSAQLFNRRGTVRLSTPHAFRIPSTFRAVNSPGTVRNHPGAAVHTPGTAGNRQSKRATARHPKHCCQQPRPSFQYSRGTAINIPAFNIPGTAGNRQPKRVTDMPSFQ